MLLIHQKPGTGKVILINCRYENVTEIIQSFLGTATWYEAILIRREPAIKKRKLFIMMDIGLSKMRGVIGGIEIPR